MDRGPVLKAPASTPEILVNQAARGATPCDIEESVLIRYLLLFGDGELCEEERSGTVKIRHKSWNS